MANRSNEESMPAEQGGRKRSGPMDDRDRRPEEDARGIGEPEESDDEFEDMEDAEDSEDEEEGSF
jgi:hypothetical protein